jgi:hypothetical protein
MRMPTTLMLAFTFGATCAVAQGQSQKPKVSKDTLSDEQMAVYRAVLKDYMKDSRGSLNLSIKTYPLVVDEGCGLAHSELGETRVPFRRWFLRGSRSFCFFPCLS